MGEITAKDVERMRGDESSVDWMDYDDLIGLFCDEIVVEASDDDYQGDTYAILRRGDEFGYLEFGWGSCSGCDALQACENDEEGAKLANELAEGVEWQTGREALKEWIAGKDWPGGYSWYRSGFPKFAEKVREAGLGDIPIKEDGDG